MTEPKKPDPLEALAGEADQLAADTAPPLGEGVTDADVAAREETEREEQGLRMIEGVAVNMVFFGLKLGRKAMAKQLPEVNETLPDEKLLPSAQAFLPLIKRHMGKVMEAVAKSPELAVALIGVLPIAMGIMEAMELSDRRAAAAKASPAPSPLPNVPEA
ncbi:hypothetical protein [uncultured Hydrogenophaga sp.]|uniref:hypothetical protein n=1 Tax=uncultured Hydrogenophaga sp. TaxID=199683 RepID=UPI00258611B8|nr:hypothetical protein [uncultured Hydrogenophaga sp.]